MPALTIGQIAGKTGYSRMRVSTFARDGRIPGKRWKTKGGHWRYEDGEELRSWILSAKSSRSGWVSRPKGKPALSATAKQKRFIAQLLKGLDSGTISQTDAARAVEILKASRAVAFSFFQESDNTAVLGSLAVMLWLESAGKRVSTVTTALGVYSDLVEKLEKISTAKPRKK